MRVRAPIVVLPASATWLMSSQPAPSSTSRPMEQNGPILASSPTFAPGSTMAEGWTLYSGILGGQCLGFRGVDDHGADLGLGDDLAVDLGLAVKPPRAAAAADFLHVIQELVPGDDRLAEFRL